MLSMAKKAEIFEKNLSQDELNTLAYIVKMDRDKEVNARVDKQIYTINQALETSMAAALFEFTDLSIAEVEEILRRSNEYMKESEEFLLKYGEDWIMKINEIKPRIKEECMKLLDQNVNGQNEAVNVLKEIFVGISNKDLANIFKESKEEWCKRCTILEKDNKAKSEEKQLSQVSTSKKENKSATEQIDNQNKLFEVIDKKMKFKGQYYDYEKDSTGLKVGVEFFRNLEEIEAFRKREEEEFNKMISEVKAAFSFEG